MQQKNLVLFIALCLLILIGWPLLMNKIFPPRPRLNEAEQTASRALPPGVRKDLLAWLSCVPGPAASGVANLLCATATHAALAPPPLPPEMAWERLPRAQRENLGRLASALGGALPGLNSFDLVALARVQTVPTTKPGAEPQQVTLGGTAGYFLTAVLTTRGAGVEKLILDKFKAATPEGMPTDQKLQLIPDDPLRGSFLMYHYPDVEGANSYPVTTLGEAIWEYKGPKNSSSQAVFSTTLPVKGGELVITRTFTLDPGTYHLGLKVEIEHKGQPGTRGDLAKFKYQLAGPHGLPIEGEWYTSVFRNPMMGMVDERGNLWRDLEETQHRITVRLGGDKVFDSLPPGSYIQYAGIANQFFASVLVVDKEQRADEPGGVDYRRILSYLRPTLETQQKKGKIKGILIGPGSMRLVLTSTERDGAEYTFRLLPRASDRLEQENLKSGTEVVVNYRQQEGFLVATDVRRGSAFRPWTQDITVRAVSEPLELKPGEKVVHKYLLYNGPVKVRLLSYFSGDERVDAALVARYADDLHLSTLTDYRSAGWPGAIAQKIFWTDILIGCTRLMHWLLINLNFVVRNYGLSIILLTVMVRALMFPISRRQAQISMRMQELAPEMKKLQEKYKNDPQAKNQAVMELYRRHNVNPLGGCLPLLLQMPIFLGLYYALQESIFFRLAPFLWMPNLAAPDMLLRWGENIPWISDPDNQGSIFYLGPFFNLLPVVAVGFMIAQQKMLTPPPADEQQALQQKLMKYMMIFFGVMFYKVAAGLCLYFIVSSLWGLAERKLLPKKKGAAAVAMARPTGGGGRPGGGGPGKPPGGRPGPGAPARGKSRRGGKKDSEPDGPMQKVRDWWAEVLKQAKKK
jgi:YidC/Oxa1 family membrane protein insertase